MITHRSDERGQMNLGWLKAKYSFSFSNYYNPDRMGFGALRVLNEDIIQGGMGFGMHPHENIEIITIMLSGSLRHRDSIGNEGIIKPGEIQVMSAGTGVRHSEVNALPHTPTHLLQIWIEPSTMDISPRYDQTKISQRSPLTIAVGNMGSEAPLHINADARISLLHLLNNEKAIEYQRLSHQHGTFILVTDGTLLINEKALSTGDSAELQHSGPIKMETTTACSAVMIDVLV